MPDSDHHSHLTLEDLLHLKRAERPSPDFWVRFEHELRQKQLAALLERRPWWQTLPRLLAQRRAFMPLGAAAILAITLVSVKSFSHDQLSRVAALNPAQTAPSVQIEPASAGSSASEQSKAMLSPAYVADSQLDDNSAVVADVPLSEHLPENAAELTPWSAPLSAQSASARLFATNNEQLERVEAGLAHSFSGHSMPMASGQVKRSGGAGAELASVSALASKRTRLLAQFNDRQFTPDLQAPALIRERLTRRLADNDTSLSEHFSRVGFKGDQVSLRF